ncbi:MULTISPECIES: electron transfer flavoprotein subunit alpha/FixB family protein [Pseudoalteromonas]|uniref:electron transfer flavoprotein subunit alpha/FixB family protein n=1 Tax=Pseudoalteromonas TaxID=53246 RepID=UPI0015FA2CB5|nr:MULTISPECIES: FAD-binding protein [unclassified Pseudoalteromonas]MBB1279415.1 electron transfer flavoprotein subunit alpha/FixB family protein [Pseudoalteromonas sp. SR41-1]MBB1298028.1 electron transfer flavoprotein subunit alpha/FixB family protein [Pseudoalteromonas sp. SR41-7]MBB1345008.1 electron transfer flavoprotein subunit alpha/FixB family protein [Pseudoalteromonas sp. SG45-2]MBB1350139.1 electron transfer flavoprotein subunit alpha/FixB family protein [Pseudoalteromonas sp. SG45-
MKTLVIAEHDNGALKPETSKTINAAVKMGFPIDVLIAGNNLSAMSSQVASIDGIANVLVADNSVYEHQLAENMSDLVLSLSDTYSHIVASATTTGKNFMPRVAALLDVAQISEIIAVVDADTFKRPIYAGNAIATVKSLDSKKVITVRASSFDLQGEQSAVAITSIDTVSDSQLSSFVSVEQTESERPELTAASVVISGGRGMQNGENFALLNGIADKLGAAIGASRAAVDAGFVPNDMQVGQTGKIVAPNLYIAVGISGAIQHLAGMKDSKVIVAINKDPDAPIFQVADYGLVADLFEVLPQLESAL